MTESSDTDRFLPIQKALAAKEDLSTVHPEGGDSGLAGITEEFLRFVWKSGIPEGFTWEQVKDVILAKFTQVTRTYEAEKPLSSLPHVPNVDNYTFEEYRDRIISCLSRFDDPPFTISRICELLLEPRKHYERGDKFLRAFEKCVAVTSTVTPNQTEMAAVESSSQNDNQTSEVTENGTNPKQTTMEKNVTENGHDATVSNGTTDQKTHNDDAVSSSGDNNNANEKSATEDNKVESSTSNEVKKDDKTEDDSRGDKRQLEETDTVAKKIARLENGEQVNGKHEEAVSGQEPVVEPNGESNGHGKEHAAKDDVQVKADTGKDAAAVDQEVVGQGAAV